MHSHSFIFHFYAGKILFWGPCFAFVWDWYSSPKTASAPASWCWQCEWWLIFLDFISTLRIYSSPLNFLYPWSLHSNRCFSSRLLLHFQMMELGSDSTSCWIILPRFFFFFPPQIDLSFKFKICCLCYMISTVLCYWMAGGV